MKALLGAIRCVSLHSPSLTPRRRRDTSGERLRRVLQRRATEKHGRNRPPEMAFRVAARTGAWDQLKYRATEGILLGLGPVRAGAVARYRMTNGSQRSWGGGGVFFFFGAWTPLKTPTLTGTIRKLQQRRGGEWVRLGELSGSAPRAAATHTESQSSVKSVIAVRTTPWIRALDRIRTRSEDVVAVKRLRDSRQASGRRSPRLSGGFGSRVEA